MRFRFVSRRADFGDHDTDLKPSGYPSVSRQVEAAPWREERYLCATRSPTMPRPLRARHSRDAARARSHHRNRLRAAPQGRRRRSSSSLHVLRFLGAAPCICACNQIEWLLALSALWDGSAAGGGACSALVGLSIGPFAACFTWRARGAACDMLRLLPD